MEKMQRAKRYILSKSSRQMQDALHKTTKQFVDWCIEQSISDVYIGNPEGVQRNTRKKKKTNKRQAQKLSNLSFGQVKKYLTYKLIQQGIKLTSIDESYTSQTCPVCQKRQKVSSRITTVPVVTKNTGIFMVRGISSPRQNTEKSFLLMYAPK